MAVFVGSVDSTVTRDLPMRDKGVIVLEGQLGAARRTMAPTGEDSKTRVCSFCSGSGHCERCGGAGTNIVRKRWPRHDQAPTCTACDGSGKCQLCHGKGILDA